MQWCLSIAVFFFVHRSFRMWRLWPFVHHLIFFWYLEKAVLCDCYIFRGILITFVFILPWVSYLHLLLCYSDCRFVVESSHLFFYILLKSKVRAYGRACVCACVDTWWVREPLREPQNISFVLWWNLIDCYVGSTLGRFIRLSLNVRKCTVWPPSSSLIRVYLMHS